MKISNDEVIQAQLTQQGNWTPTGSRMFIRKDILESGTFYYWDASGKGSSGLNLFHVNRAILLLLAALVGLTLAMLCML